MTYVKKKRHHIQSMFDNPALIGPKVDPKNIPPKKIGKVSELAIKRSFYAFEAGKTWLKETYAQVEVELNFMDIFGFNMEGESCEIEVKMADYDFYKERTRESKIIKHSSYKEDLTFCPTFFYFLVPTPTVKKALRECDRHFHNYGVLEFTNTGELIIRRESQRLTQKPFLGELLDYKGAKDRKHTFYTKI